MVKVLVVSVGGSWQPIINVCKSNKFDYIFFLCSENGKASSSRIVDGEGNPCVKPPTPITCPKCNEKNNVVCAECGASISKVVHREPSIVAQLRLKADKYEKITVKDPDDLELLFSALKKIDTRLQKLFPNQDWSISANYTGGTKTMSVALGLMAVLCKWDLLLNIGPRNDLVKVKDNDIPMPVPIELIEKVFLLKWVKTLLDRYDYRAAEELLTEFMKRYKRSNKKGLLSLQ
ncbi:MAG TPA: hypothetical protein VKX40_12605, partial [Aequorivita sp.]|nr:hypothetical protein [Aequorivita sp.]